jgi:hypothetical protein
MGIIGQLVLKVKLTSQPDHHYIVHASYVRLYLTRMATSQQSKETNDVADVVVKDATTNDALDVARIAQFKDLLIEREDPLSSMATDGKDPLIRPLESSQQVKPVVTIRPLELAQQPAGARSKQPSSRAIAQQPAIQMPSPDNQFEDASEGEEHFETSHSNRLPVPVAGARSLLQVPHAVIR